MCDLEQVDPWQAFAEQARVDVLLDVTHQQEAAWPNLAEQHDRDVVDARATVGRFGWNLPSDRPEDP